MSDTPSGLDHTELPRRLRRLRLVAFDFDGVFTDNMVYVFSDGVEAVRCSRADGIGLRLLERLGVRPVILSTETNPVVAVRAQKLQLVCHQALEDKRAVLEAIATEMGITTDETAYVGNDVNDLPCLRWAGFPIVVQDAHPEVLPYAQYRTTRPGGHGAVREVCDLIAAAHAQTPG
jgi:3-deoxy-D-manno-octulosonate 8-phosphate phosphatase (KDO 8-P phosphatase)